MKRSVRILILCSLLAGFGSASASASDSASSGGLSMCFAPSVFPGVGGLWSEIRWRANCIAQALIEPA